MSRHRFFTDQTLAADQTIEVVGERAHYLGRVLRMKAGAALTVFANGSDDYAATVTELRKNAVLIQLREATPNTTESPLHIRLIQGISRGERMDFTVQKATELGVRALQPVHSRFSVVRLNADRARRRLLHWQKIAQGACEQCGRNRLPSIEPPLSFAEGLETARHGEGRLVLLPGAGGQLADLPDTLSRVDLLVGPEGGLSDEEAGKAIDSGFTPITLGPRTLRSETAALAAIALAQARWGDLK